MGNGMLKAQFVGVISCCTWNGDGNTVYVFFKKVITYQLVENKTMIDYVLVEIETRVI